MAFTRSHRRRGRLGRGLLGGAAATLLPLAVFMSPGAAQAAPPTDTETSSAPSRVRLSVPEPTGRYPVGRIELHLVDRDRADPWAEGEPRELMVSIWYPARPSRGHPEAPYMPAGVAAHYEQEVATVLELDPGQIALTRVDTDARVGAPVARPRGGRPVVLYSPGGGVSRTLGTTLVEDLASRGYVVVTMDHTHEAAAVQFPDGRVVTQASDLGDYREIIRTRVRDTRFVLDQLAVLASGRNPDVDGRRLPARLGRALDLSRVGMFGHSAGGFTAGETMVNDRRIDAGIDMDGSMGYFATREFGEVAKRGLDRPFMLMGAGGHDRDADPTWAAFWEHQRGWKLNLHLPAGRHFSYVDHQTLLPQLEHQLDLTDAARERIDASIGTAPWPARVIASERAYVAAFFDEHLRCRAQRLLDSPSPHHPDFRFVP